MSRILHRDQLRLVPVEPRDVDRVVELLRLAAVRRYLCDDAPIPRETVAAGVADSLDPSSSTSQWCIETADGTFAGLVGLQPPVAVAQRLRAIGWRSLEILIALDPACWGRGLAAGAVEAVADYARTDGVTFALIGAVDEPNERSHRLMARCGFAELGRMPGPRHELVVYERAL